VNISARAAENEASKRKRERERASPGVEPGDKSAVSLEACEEWGLGGKEGERRACWGRAAPPGKKKVGWGGFVVVFLGLGERAG
jgi:hypothetical protein